MQTKCGPLQQFSPHADQVSNCRPLCKHLVYTIKLTSDCSPWEVTKSSLKYQDKRHPLVVTVEHMLLILAGKPRANAAAVQLCVVQMGVIRGGQSVRFLHEAI